MARGRRTEGELREVRGRIETLMFQGLRSPAIHRALTGPDGAAPIVVAERQVRGHMAAVRRAWLERDQAQTINAARAETIAGLEDMKRVALQRSALSARTTIGVGYFNAALKVEELRARVTGVSAPVRTELSGPGGRPLELVAVVLDDWGAALEPTEEARRLRLRADALELSAAETRQS